MKILALVTARGGSKRLPGKNIRQLGGKPLVLWSIHIAQKIAQICDVLVSTDDPAIACICKTGGAFVPWLRPSELAEDATTSVDVALHALDWYEGEKGPVDGLLLMQPTSPFRTEATVKRGIELFFETDFRSVVGLSPCREHPAWASKIQGKFLIPFVSSLGLSSRSQDLEPAYFVNGSFYLISPAELRESRSFSGTHTVPLIIESPVEALDIDTEWDFTLAEIFVEKNFV